MTDNTKHKAVIESGIYTDMSADDYFAADAFNASCCGPLLSSFPARLKHEKPRTKAMDDGQIAHRLVLEGVDEIEASNRFVVLPKGFSMTQTKKYGDLIERINATGAEAITEQRVDTIRGMFEALKSDEDVCAALSNGKPEVAVFWIDPEFEIPCKMRLDWMPNNGDILPDYKTCASIDDAELGRAIVNYRVAHRSLHYQQGAKHALGAEDPLYLPIWQEKTPPYFCAMRPVAGVDLDLVAHELSKARSSWAHCWRSNYWPGPEHFREIDLPGWERRRLETEYETERATGAQEPADEVFAS